MIMRYKNYLGFLQYIKEILCEFYQMHYCLPQTWSLVVDLFEERFAHNHRELRYCAIYYRIKHIWWGVLTQLGKEFHLQDHRKKLSKK